MIPPRPRSRIAELRKRAGLTQKQLAVNLEMTINTIANWENGRVNLGYIEIVIKLCEVFQCRPHDLIQYSNENEENEQNLSLEEMRDYLGTSESADGIMRRFTRSSQEAEE